MLIIYASSTMESGVPRIDCLVLIVYPPPLNLIQSPMNWLSFMHPLPSSLEPHELIVKRCSSILHPQILFGAP